MLRTPLNQDPALDYEQMADDYLLARLVESHKDRFNITWQSLDETEKDALKQAIIIKAAHLSDEVQALNHDRPVFARQGQAITPLANSMSNNPNHANQVENKEPIIFENPDEGVLFPLEL